MRGVNSLEAPLPNSSHGAQAARGAATTADLLLAEIRQGAKQSVATNRVDASKRSTQPEGEPGPLKPRSEKAAAPTYRQRMSPELINEIWSNSQFECDKVTARLVKIRDPPPMKPRELKSLLEAKTGVRYSARRSAKYLRRERVWVIFVNTRR